MTASVSKGRRGAIARNHTSAHLLQKALREVLGSHVHQAGSYEDDERVRFDFTHFSAVTPEELSLVEHIVKMCIRDRRYGALGGQGHKADLAVRFQHGRLQLA